MHAAALEVDALHQVEGSKAGGGGAAKMHLIPIPSHRTYIRCQRDSPTPNFPVPAALLSCMHACASRPAS